MLMTKLDMNWSGKKSFWPCENSPLAIKGIITECLVGCSWLYRRTPLSTSVPDTATGVPVLAMVTVCVKFSGNDLSQYLILAWGGISRYTISVVDAKSSRFSIGVPPTWMLNFDQSPWKAHVGWIGSVPVTCKSAVMTTVAGSTNPDPPDILN